MRSCASGSAGDEAAALIRLGRIDHVGLRVADLDEASARWCVQFGLVERGRDGGRAFLACNDEPYCLELVEGGEPGPRPRGVRAAPRRARSTTRARISRSAASPSRSARASLWVADPDGRSIQLHAAPRSRASEVDRWPQHARPSSTVHLGGPRRLGHVNCLTGDIAGERLRSTPTCSGCGSPTGSATRGSGSTSTPSTT